MAPLKLYYFNVRSKGEPVRLLLQYSGTPYEEVTVDFNDWPSWKPKMPMGVMPVIEMDGKMLSASTAITRYLARNCGIAGKNSWDMAKADQYVDGIWDMWGLTGKVYTPLISGDQKTYEEQLKIFRDEVIPPFLDRYEKFLDENKTGWLVGDDVTWADLVVTEYLSDMHDGFVPDIYKNHPKMKQYVDKVRNLPQIKDYVAKRAKVPF